MDGALAAHPRTRSVPPARNASASSIQSPPASAEETSVAIFVSRVRPARCVAEVEVTVDELPQAEVFDERGRQQQARVATGRSSSKAMESRVGLLGDSIEWVLPVSGE